MLHPKNKVKNVSATKKKNIESSPIKSISSEGAIWQNLIERSLMIFHLVITVLLLQAVHVGPGMPSEGALVRKRLTAQLTAEGKLPAGEKTTKCCRGSVLI